MSHFLSLVCWIVRLPAFWVPLQTPHVLSLDVRICRCAFSHHFEQMSVSRRLFTSSQRAAEGLNMSFAHDQNDLHIGVGILRKKKKP